MHDLSLLKTLGLDLDYRPARALLRGRRDFPIDDAITPQMRDYLIAGLLKVRSKEKGLVRLVPNRAQLEYAKRCTHRDIVLKARQLGITTYIAARFFVQTITQPGTMTVQVAHNQESAVEIFRIVHRFLENLPEGTQQGALVTAHANVRQIVFRHLDSEYRVETADDNAGRGLTIHHLHCSEVARWSRGGMEALASLRAAVPHDGDIVLESTPNGAGGVFYEEWQRAEETGYTRHFFPWWYAPEYGEDLTDVRLGELTDEEQELVSKHKLTEAQIAFRRARKAQLRGLAAQEFAEDPVACFRASGESVFEMEAIERALQGCGEPLEMKDNRRLRVWFPAQKGKQYIVGVDPAGGGCEGDYSCAQVIDRLTGMQCAELYGHYPPQELGKRIVELAKSYNGALVAVERNNHGYGVLAVVENEGYLNVYREGQQGGWLTSAVTRPAMIENLAAVLVTEPMLFHSPLLLGECRTFVRHADGSTGAAAGAHDDSVMAMAIAFAVRRAVAGETSRSGMALASLSREQE
ncbi:MAG: terminase [Terriglobales bacterium]